MLSRVADSIYWMSRYIERAENVARFIDVNLHLMLDLPLDVGEQWLPLVTTTGDEALYRERYRAPTRENVIRFLAFDTDYPNSIISCLRAARENARSVREVISSEMWEQVNKFYLTVNASGAEKRARAAPHEFFTDVKLSSHLFTGVTNATMTHGEGWHFSRLGRLLERAEKTTRILDVKYFLLLPSAQSVGRPEDDVQWSAVLRSASAFEMYRKRHGLVAPERIVDFLLLDPEFPRSVRYCLIGADRSLHSITGSPRGTFQTTAERRLGQVRSELDFAQVRDIIVSGLHEFLDGFQVKLNRVGDAIFETFFALRPIEAHATSGGLS